MDKKYIVGNAKTNLDNPITKNYNRFFLAFIVSEKDDIILETEVSSILKITNSFVREIFVGKNFVKDQDKIIEEVERTYLGSSQKSIIVAYKDAIKKYIKSKN